MNFVKTISVAIAASVIAIGAASAQGKKWETVKIATEGAYAPWNFTGAGGKLEGFEIDLANNLCERMKVKCEIVAQDWDGIIPALNAKKYDAIMAGMSITDDRKKVIEFSRAYANSPNGFLVARNSPLAKMPGTGQAFSLTTQPAEAEKAIEAAKAVLKGKTVGVQVSTIHSAFADKYLKGTAEIREYKTTEAHDLDLAAGRLDAILADATALIGTLEKPEFKDYAMVGPSITGGMLGAGVGVGLRKD
ncbi:MAG: transporter substrate-binding domain-containing protein, partial [Microvirga sp.]